MHVSKSNMIMSNVTLMKSIDIKSGNKVKGLHVSSRTCTPKIKQLSVTCASQKKATTSTGRDSSQIRYINVTGFPFPLGPLTKRRTIRREIEKGVMWTFEQPQSLGFSNVTTNVRMTVIKLKSGGLWVHAPIAPTTECIKLLKELDAPVEYIILPTFAYEHKIFVGPFSRKFPKAQVFIAPRQWSWPINLPPQLFGIFAKGTLKNDDLDTPWGDEIEQKVLVSSVGIGPYIEVAFFHKRTKTLLVTDAVISVPSNPSPLVEENNLIDAAKSNFFVKVLAGDQANEPVNGVPLQPDTLTPAVKDLGWKRMALQILYIVPGDLRDPNKGFAAIANKLIVGPILKTLVFSTEPELSREWIDDICSSWNFKQIVPAHFTAPIKAGPKDLRNAFDFLYPQGSTKQTGLFGLFPSNVGQKTQYPEEDIKALDAAKRFLIKVGAVKGTV